MEIIAKCVYEAWIIVLLNIKEILMFKLIKETKLKEGGYNWEFEITEEFKKFVRDKYGVKRDTNKLCNRLILEFLHESMKRDMLNDLEKNHNESLELNGIKV